MEDKKYTLPAKVAFYYYSLSEDPVTLVLANGNKYECIEANENGFAEGKIIISTANEYFPLNPSDNVLVPGDILSSAWNYWKNGGKEEFNEWVVQSQS